MRTAKEDSGQILIVMAIVLPVLILFVALAIDGGMAYIAKANLSKAVDGACLTGMKNLWQGETTAKSLAGHIFNANYGTTPPVPIMNVTTDTYGNKLFTVSATASVPTFLARSLFQFWSVSDTATATRGKLVMSLVLDRSGSMATNGGGAALKTVVPIFINYFDDTIDTVAMVSYASNAKVEVSIKHNFKSPITTAVGAFSFTGATFGTGGTYVATDGPPLALADNQIGTVPVVAGDNTIRVVVYVTDGLMNTIQDTFTCYTSSTAHITTLINYGGYDSGTNEVDAFDPVGGANWCPSANVGSGSCITGNASEIPYSSAGKACQNPYNTYVTKFPSQQTGLQRTINRTNVTSDAQYRALTTAGTMRAETPGTYIYVIGVGSSVDATFLGKLANDPTSSTFNVSLPPGQYFPVPDCTSGTTATCTQELQTAFQTIAAKVLLRLTQ
jgi:Flp pilus assembly protein TadG